MKKAINTLFILLFLILSVSSALAAEKKNKSAIKIVDNYIAVFDFEVTTGNKGISRPLADKVIHEFSQSDKYEVIDRGNMNKILKEQKFQMSGCVAQQCKVEAGQILGVGKIVNGSVGLVGETYYLTLQLIDVQTGKVELSAEDECRCKIDELLGSTRRLAKKLLGEKVEQPGTTAPNPATIAESKAKAEEIARAKTESYELAREKAALAREKQEMARERQEMERQKALDAEREQLADERHKIEAERQQLAITKRSSQPTSGETARDGHFIAYNNGTVLDTRTNLMWAEKDNEIDINWEDARNYCENYRGGGYTDWRMPTQDELAGLYDSKKSYKVTQRDYSVHLTELIRLTEELVWASETEGSNVAHFSFNNGRRHWDLQSFDPYYRALPVRSVK